MLWLKSKYYSYVQGKAEHYRRAADRQVVFVCASRRGLLKKPSLPHPNVVSQHRPKKKINKNLRPKGEFKNSSSALGAPGRLFLTAISRQDVDGAGQIESFRALEVIGVGLDRSRGLCFWSDHREAGKGAGRGGCACRVQVGIAFHSSWLIYLLFPFLQEFYTNRIVSSTRWGDDALPAMDASLRS